jgi:hypothetical protein
MRQIIKRLARGAAIAAAIVASSSALQATGQPLFAKLGDVGFNLASVFSEVDETRRKITRAVIAQQANRRARRLTASATSRARGGADVRPVA